MTTKLAQQFLERFRDLDTNSRGKYFGHKLSAELNSAESFATRSDRDGDSLILTFADRSRIKIEDPTQKTDRARFYQLGGI
jgi:hypothetical protein